MPDIRITASLEEFRLLAQQGNLIPLVATFVADVETPVSAFAKLASRGPCFLFESAEKNEESGRFSFIGVDPYLFLESREKFISITENGHNRQFSTDSDPLGELQRVMDRF